MQLTDEQLADIKDNYLGQTKTIREWAPDLVASANPGCAMHLGGAGVATRHPMQLVAEALGLV